MSISEFVAVAGLGPIRFAAISLALIRFAVPYPEKKFDFNDFFAMIHSRKMEQMLEVIGEFVEEYQVNSYELLPTVSELKKEPVAYILQRG